MICCPRCGSENNILSPNCLRGDCQTCGLSWLRDDGRGITSYWQMSWIDIPEGALPILGEKND
jgi:transposase-like protein